MAFKLPFKDLQRSLTSQQVPYSSFLLYRRPELCTEKLFQYPKLHRKSEDPSMRTRDKVFDTLNDSALHRPHTAALELHCTPEASH